MRKKETVERKVAEEIKSMYLNRKLNYMLVSALLDDWVEGTHEHVLKEMKEMKERTD